MDAKCFFYRDNVFQNAQRTVFTQAQGSRSQQHRRVWDLF